MFTPRAAALGLLCPLALITACAQAPTVTPTPAPIIRCTPEAGGAEYDCSQAQHDEMVAKDRLYAEAEAVYRVFFSEDVRIARLGGVPTRTDVIDKTTMGDFRSDSMDLYRDMHAKGRRSVDGEIVLVRLDRSPGLSQAGSVVSLQACTDASTTRTEEKRKVIGKGAIVEDQLFFAFEDGVLKITATVAMQVESC